MPRDGGSCARCPMRWSRIAEKRWSAGSMGCFAASFLASPSPSRRATIPRSRHNPKILGRDDAEVIRYFVAVETPVSGHLLAQARQVCGGELRECPVAAVVGDVLVHQPLKPFDRIK